MIDVKQAVKSASEYLRSLYAAEDVTDLRLEEVIFEDAPDAGTVVSLMAAKQPVPKSRWLVTLSFARFPNREYKEIEIDAESGAVKAMRIRLLSRA